MKNLKIVRVDYKYCDYLRKFDFRVSYNKQEKELRPFVGVLFKIKDFEYFAPLSSPKAKHKRMHNTLDFLKIKDGELGALNFNNMIPVTENNYELIFLNETSGKISDVKYKKLLKEQLDWLNANCIQVNKRSFGLYRLYNTNKLPKSIKDRCCNFKLLEEKCLEYNKVKVS